MAILLFFRQLSKKDSVSWTLAAVVLSLLKFRRNFTNVISCLVAFNLESSISFHSYHSGEISLCHFSSSVVSSYYLLLWIWNSLSNNSMLFNLHFVRTIITLINLNNFKYPTKIRLCSHANQNDLLRDLFFSFSAHWDKWKQIARWSKVSALLVSGEIWMFREVTKMIHRFRASRGTF